MKIRSIAASAATIPAFNLPLPISLRGCRENVHNPIDGKVRPAAGFGPAVTGRLLAAPIVFSSALRLRLHSRSASDPHEDSSWVAVTVRLGGHRATFGFRGAQRLEGIDVRL